MVVAISLIASQHVGFNLVTGFDLETVTANVEFSAATTDREQAAFLQHLETTLQDVDETTGNANLLGFTTKRNLALFDEDKLTGAQFAQVTGNYAYEESRNSRRPSSRRRGANASRGRRSSSACSSAWKAAATTVGAT